MENLTDFEVVAVAGRMCGRDVLLMPAVGKEKCADCGAEAKWAVSELGKVLATGEIKRWCWCGVCCPGG